MGYLAAHRISRADQIALVIGHIDDGGDPTGGGRAGRTDEILLVFLAERMHLRIDGAGQDQRVAQLVTLMGRGRPALANMDDLALAHRHIAILDDEIGEHDGAGQREIEIGHVTASKGWGWSWLPHAGRARGWGQSAAYV